MYINLIHSEAYTITLRNTVQWANWVQHAEQACLQLHPFHLYAHTATLSQVNLSDYNTEGWRATIQISRFGELLVRDVYMPVCNDILAMNYALIEPRFLRIRFEEKPTVISGLATDCLINNGDQ